MSFIAEFGVELPMLREASEAVPEMEFLGEDIVLENDRPRKFIFAVGDPHTSTNSKRPSPRTRR